MRRVFFWTGIHAHSPYEQLSLQLRFMEYNKPISISSMLPGARNVRLTKAEIYFGQQFTNGNNNIIYTQQVVNNIAKDDTNPFYGFAEATITVSGVPYSL